jgi:hypothetical protein
MRASGKMKYERQSVKKWNGSVQLIRTVLPDKLIRKQMLQTECPFIYKKGNKLMGGLKTEK